MAETSPRRKRVLIADDMSEIRAFIVDLLHKNGYEPVEAGDGPGTLAQVMEGNLDLALIDILMPGMTGLQVLKEARRLGSQVPIILFTGLGNMDLGLEGMKEGAADILSKPITLDELLDAIRKALTGGPPREQK